VPLLTHEALDAATFKGFAAAVEAVGWVEFFEEGAVLPRVRDNQDDVGAIRKRWRDKKAKQRERNKREGCPASVPQVSPGTTGGQAGDVPSMSPHRERGRGRGRGRVRQEDTDSASALSGPTSAKTPSRPPRSADPITLDRDASPARFVGVSAQQRATWAAAYPAVDIDAELARAAAWCITAGPKGHKTRPSRFLTSWLARAQDDAGRRGTTFRHAARPATVPPDDEPNPMLAVLAAASAQVAAEETQGARR